MNDASQARELAQLLLAGELDEQQFLREIAKADDRGNRRSESRFGPSEPRRIIRK